VRKIIFAKIGIFKLSIFIGGNDKDKQAVMKNSEIGK